MLPEETREGEPLITVGSIVAPHGVRGEVRVVPATDFPERFAPGSEVIATGPVDRTLTVERARFHKSVLLIEFSELHSRCEAEELRGALLQVPSSELMPLAEGEFYRFQLLGLRVESAEEGLLGRVQDILETGANDVLVVAPDDAQRGQPVLVPATREVVLAIEPGQGRILVRLPAGLLE